MSYSDHLRSCVQQQSGQLIELLPVVTPPVIWGSDTSRDDRHKSFLKQTKKEHTSWTHLEVKQPEWNRSRKWPLTLANWFSNVFWLEIRNNVPPDFLKKQWNYLSEILFIRLSTRKTMAHCYPSIRASYPEREGGKMATVNIVCLAVCCYNPMMPTYQSQLVLWAI